MGENKHIEELDNFSKKYMQSIEVEEPSSDFTESIMNQLVNVEIENKNIYKTEAIISKRIWIVLVVVFVSCVLYVSKSSSMIGLKLPKVVFDRKPLFQLSNLMQEIAISDMVLLVSFLFVGMFFLQILFLKGYFLKRLDL